MVSVRKAVRADVDEITRIYDAIHTEIEEGRANTGWVRGVYPTRDTAMRAVSLGDMFVMEDECKIVAAARINREQVDVYENIAWQYAAVPEKVMVLHTLVVDPARGGKGYGSRFVAYYERCAKESFCTVLRMDTNEKNTVARALYKKLGYREAGITPCVFNGITGVGLVCLEKKL